MTTINEAARPAKKKVAARKKVAAAALAVSAGVIGTGFAAGVLTFGSGAEHGFGTGVAQNVNGTDHVVDITGQLDISQQIATDFKQQQATGSPYTATESDKYTISGFNELANVEGATYHIAVRTGTGSSDYWTEVATGEIPESGTVELPMKHAGTNVKEIAVSLEK